MTCGRENDRSRIGRRFLSALLAALLFVGGAMAASPELHDLLHHDSGDHEHVCLATLITAGACDAPAPGAICIEPAALLLADAAPRDRTRADNFFLLGAVLEHAPPARS